MSRLWWLPRVLRRAFLVDDTRDMLFTEVKPLSLEIEALIALMRTSPQEWEEEKPDPRGDAVLYQPTYVHRLSGIRVSCRGSLPDGPFLENHERNALRGAYLELAQFVSDRQQRERRAKLGTTLNDLYRQRSPPGPPEPGK